MITRNTALRIILLLICSVFSAGTFAQKGALEKQGHLNSTEAILNILNGSQGEISAKDLPIATFELPVIENPGPKPDIRARIMASVVRSPIGTKFDSLKGYLQTLERCNDHSGCGQPLAPSLRSRLKGHRFWIAPKMGKVIVMRRVARSDVKGVYLILAQIAMDGSWGQAMRFGMRENPQAFTPSDSFFVASVDSDTMLVSVDTLERCDNERRTGFMFKLSWSQENLLWVSPLRVSGARHFAFTDRSIFAVDGGSCEPDYLHEIDQETGAVIARTKIASGMDAGDFLVLDGRELYLILYNRFMHLRLPRQ